MPVSDLRDAFNSVAEPAGFNCQTALMGYVRQGGAESQVITFRGKAADGSDFEIKSEWLRANADLNQASRDTAQQLIDQRKTPT